MESASKTKYETRRQAVFSETTFLDYVEMLMGIWEGTFSIYLEGNLLEGTFPIYLEGTFLIDLEGGTFPIFSSPIDLDKGFFSTDHETKSAVFRRDNYSMPCMVNDVCTRAWSVVDIALSL